MAKNTSFAASLIFIAIIIAFAIFLNKNTKQSSTSPSNGQAQEGGEAVKIKTSSKLYYFTSKDGAGQIICYDPMTGKSKIIFTDADESEKIKNARSISSRGVLVLASDAKESEESVGNVYLIDFNGKKNKILDSYSNPQVPVISEDGTKILLISFDNSEKQYGFHLISQDIASKNKKEIVVSKEGFSSYTYDRQGKNVVYGVTTAEGSKIYTVSSSGGTPKEIFKSEKQVYSLSWTGNEIYFVLTDAGPNTANSAQIYSIFEQGGEAKQITNNSVNDNYPSVSDSGDLSYFSRDYPEGLADPRENGKIIISDLSDKNPQEIGQGLYVIGWE